MKRAPQVTGSSPFDRGYVSVFANEKPRRTQRYREAPANGIMLPGSRTTDKPGRMKAPNRPLKPSVVVGEAKEYDGD